MTKLEKIEEMLREYDNGCDSSIKPEDILEGIRNVISDHSLDRYEQASIQTSAGKLVVFTDNSDNSAGIWLVPEEESGDVVELAHANANGQDVVLYTYEDIVNEECVETVFRHEDIMQALGMEEAQSERGE